MADQIQITVKTKQNSMMGEQEVLDALWCGMAKSKLLEIESITSNTKTVIDGEQLADIANGQGKLFDDPPDKEAS